MLRLLLALFMVADSHAWATGSMVSSFGGAVLLTQRPMASPSAIAGSSITMKKGKANVPPQMRGQYAKMKQMAAMREQLVAASTPGADGLPVFNLFVRTQKKNMWYPCGSFKGDDRSAALAKNYASGGLLAGVSKKQIDAGIAGSLYRDQEKLKENIVRAYPQLRKTRDELEFGYKLAFEGLSPEQAKEIKVVEPKEQKGVLDGIKTLFS